MSTTPCPTGCGHAHGLGGCSSWECHPRDARPTPPPVPPDAPGLLSVVEELEGLLAEAKTEHHRLAAVLGSNRGDIWLSYCDSRGEWERVPAANGDLIVTLVNNAERLLAAARLAATLQADQELLAEVAGIHRDPLNVRTHALIELGDIAARALVPLPVEDEEEPK